MTRDDLAQIYYINKEISMWERELNNLREQSLMKSKEITDMPFANTNTTGDPVAELAMKITDVEMVILGKKKELELERARVIDFIGNIEDSLMRMIVKYRCVDCLSWYNVAIRIGGNNTEDSVKKAFSRFCKAQDEILR